MSERLRGVLGWAAIVAALVAFSAYATWPLVEHMGEAVYEDDPLIYTWDLWWVARSIVNLDNPWWSSYVLSPYGSYLGFHTLAPLVGVVMSPVTLLAGPLAAYNLTKLLLGPLAAIAAYAMGRSLGLSKPAAWVTGGVWGFSTIAIWRTGFHMNFGGALPLLPLVIAGAARYEHSGRRRDALLTGAALGAVALVDATMAILAGMALAAWLLIAIWNAERRGLWLRGIGWLAGAALLVAAPQIAMMARTAQQGGYKPNLEVQAATWVAGAASVKGMLSPADVAPWFPGNLESWAYRQPLGEATPTYGWGALALALAAIVLLAALWRRRSADERARRAIAWGAVLLLAGTVLALGPVLNISGTPHRPLAIAQHGQQLSALMPYTWMVQLPLLQDARVPARFTMLGMLGLSVLAGFGFAALWARGIAGRVIAVAALAFAAVEAGYPDAGVGGKRVPGTRDALYAPVKADESDSVVVDIPLGFIGATYGAGRSPGKMEPMLRSAQHGHPAAFASLARLAQPQIDQLVARPFYAAVLAQQGTGVDDAAPLDAGDLDVLRTDLASLRVGWVVQWPTASARVGPFLRSLGFAPVRSQDGIVLWRAPTAR